MRGAIIGFGKIAMGHLVGYSRVDALSIGAVVDVSAGRRQAAQDQFGLAAYADLAELLANERIDFIDVCTPPSTHAELSRQGLNAGMHVLCEKPVFLPEEDGYESQLRLIDASDRVFYPCHVYKFAPVLASVRELIADEAFGKVLSADFRTLRHGHAVGVPEWQPDWRRTPAISRGGILRDHGPHSIYIAMHLTGSTPLEVSCVLGRLRDEYQGTEDTALVRMRCTGGVEVTFTLSWAAGHRSTGYTVTGASGAVIVDGDKLVHASGGEVVHRTIESGFDDPSHQEWFGRMLLDFADMVDHPSRQVALAREALITSLVIDGAYRSAEYDGRWVDVSLPESFTAVA
ncbi:Gfo/Idh/MocA family protein [Saccharomonospora xinjiangensis]|uniref:Gfo/Idh/MocA family protein n=1 Tax=Saccharomonospora xinjiangensis TaxID=75294 RepID=UPI00350FFC0D